jgi:hypothetical protein
MENWKGCFMEEITMTDKEKAQAIVEKYNKDFGLFVEKATRKEFKTVLMQVANDANDRQRKLVGLDK